MSAAQKRSPRAYARFRELVKAANREPVEQPSFDLTDATDTWWQLPYLEAYVFGIDPALANALMWAHVRYIDMIGLTCIEFYEFRDDDRAAFADLFKGECIYSMDAALSFMVLACDMDYVQAMAWVCRVQIQNIRSELIAVDGFSGSPGWAYTWHPNIGDPD
ncbi:hypothetical protein ACO0LM_22165 [Undibacterium sp. Di26W]|uniref:hypothetical protein n=1 Tax=Undibacterium sp. Di26W TaxID=3413035 RepID=UPI003BEFC591